MKNMLDILRFHTMGISEFTLNEVIKTNEESQKHGLVLTAAEVKELIEARNRSIQNHGRVELGIEAVKKIIAVFCTSPYIFQADYAQTMNELVEIFYYMKNETEDRIGDEELIGIMHEFFDSSCRGSLELLKTREMAVFARTFRCGLQTGNTLEGEQK